VDGTLFVALLTASLAGPEPTEAPRRGYQGPTAAPDAPESVSIELGDTAPVEKEDARKPSEREPRPKPDATKVGVSERATQPRETAAFEIPRALSTVEGFPPEEVAVFHSPGGKVAFSPGIQVRSQIGWVSEFTLDRGPANEEGVPEVGRYDESVFSTGRVRWNPTLEVGPSFRLVGTLDLASGRWAPEGSDNPVIQQIIEPPNDSVAVGQPPGQATFAIVDPQELYIVWTGSFAQLRLGQMGSTWGQGILSNDGNNMDRFGDMRFGDDGPGDLTERILIGTRPFAPLGGPAKDVVTAIGGDLVFRDSNANLVEGDLAGQAIFVLRYQPSDRPENWIGAYAVYRRQRSADDGDVYENDDDLEVGVGDLAGQGTLWLRRNLQLLGAFEGVIVGGRTTWVWDENHDQHRILQTGLAVRAYVGDHRTWLVGFDGGYASGDADPNDDVVSNFTFDSGHTAGLLLFQQVRGWRTARSELLATDGSLSGVAANGTQFIPTGGSVTNAIYVHPKARYALRERFEVWGGPLVAFSAVPIVDPYTTQLAGGVPTNSVGGDGNERHYGTELDVGLRARVDIRKLWLMAGLQYGVLFPAKGLANAAGETDDPVHGLWFRTEIRY